MSLEATEGRSVNLFFAIANHSLLLVTFRHSGQGLPRESLALGVLLVVLSVAVALMKWQSVLIAGFWMLTLSFAFIVSVPFSVAIALISTVVDLAVIVLDLGLDPASWWNLSAQVLIAYRINKLSRAA